MKDDGCQLSEGAHSQFSRSTKLGDDQILQLAYFFCLGLPVAQAASGSDVTTKTAREHYLAFRARLTQSKFSRWHNANAMLVTGDPALSAELIKPAFFDVLAHCHANRKCAQNYRLGYRSTRKCKQCPLGPVFTNPVQLDEALSLIDAVQSFYGTLGIKGESARDSVALFRERLVHTVSVATAVANSRDRANGLKDPLEMTYLSVGMLLDTLLTDCAERPL